MSTHMDLKIYLRQVWIKCRYSHFLRLFFDLLAKTGVRVSPYYIVLEGLFGETIPELEKGFEDYELGFLGEDDMAAIAAIPGWDLAEANLKERLGKGQLCFGLRYQGRPVSFNWFDFEEFLYGKQRFPMKKNEAYLFDAYTDMDFRGQGLVPYVRYQSYKELAKMGRTRLYSGSDFFNTSSIRFKRKLKAQLVEFYLLIILLKKWHIRFCLKRVPIS
jgi:hypothetical protein